MLGGRLDPVLDRVREGSLDDLARMTRHRSAAPDCRGAEREASLLRVAALQCAVYCRCESTEGACHDGESLDVLP